MPALPALRSSCQPRLRWPCLWPQLVPALVLVAVAMVSLVALVAAARASPGRGWCPPACRFGLRGPTPSGERLHRLGATLALCVHSRALMPCQRRQKPRGDNSPLSV